MSDDDDEVEEEDEGRLCAAGIAREVAGWCEDEDEVEDEEEDL